MPVSSRFLPLPLRAGDGGRDPGRCASARYLQQPLALPAPRKWNGEQVAPNPPLCWAECHRRGQPTPYRRRAEQRSAFRRTAAASATPPHPPAPARQRPPPRSAPAQHQCTLNTRRRDHDSSPGSARERRAHPWTRRGVGAHQQASNPTANARKCARIQAGPTVPSRRPTSRAKNPLRVHSRPNILAFGANTAGLALRKRRRPHTPTHPSRQPPKGANEPGLARRPNHANPRAATPAAWPAARPPLATQEATRRGCRIKPRFWQGGNRRSRCGVRACCRSGSRRARPTQRCSRHRRAKPAERYHPRLSTPIRRQVHRGSRCAKYPVLRSNRHQIASGRIEPDSHLQLWEICHPYPSRGKTTAGYVAIQNRIACASSGVIMTGDAHLTPNSCPQEITTPCGCGRLPVLG